MSYHNTEVCSHYGCVMDALPSSKYCVVHTVERTYKSETEPRRLELVFKEHPWLKAHIEKLENRIHELEFDLWKMTGSK